MYKRKEEKKKIKSSYMSCVPSIWSSTFDFILNKKRRRRNKCMLLGIFSFIYCITSFYYYFFLFYSHLLSLQANVCFFATLTNIGFMCTLCVWVCLCVIWVESNVTEIGKDIYKDEEALSSIYSIMFVTMSFSLSLSLKIYRSYMS